MKEEILAVHKAFIDAHLNKNVEFFVQDYPEYFYSVSRGEILRPSKEDFRAMLSRYLNNATFTEYRDVCEPVIGFSKDGSLAWVIMQVKVTGKLRIDENTEMDLDDTWAGIMLYEHRASKWARIAEVSNFKNRK